MNTRIFSQLAALAIALVMNSVIIGGMAYVFSTQAKDSPTVLLHRAAAAHEVV